MNVVKHDHICENANSMGPVDLIKRIANGDEQNGCTLQPNSKSRYLDEICSLRGKNELITEQLINYTKEQYNRLY